MTPEKPLEIDVNTEFTFGQKERMPVVGCYSQNNRGAKCAI